MKKGMEKKGQATFLPSHSPYLPTITFPQLQTHSAANSGHFSPSCVDKLVLCVQARLKAYKELRLDIELQRSISAFSGKAPI